ncbi:hypothetical protein PSD17_45510 [Pseudonocardia sp. D17]|nr:hypothetical protein PSD17_45510 [Pseudonocardia sp. D17]
MTPMTARRGLRLFGLAVPVAVLLVLAVGSPAAADPAAPDDCAAPPAAVPATGGLAGSIDSTVASAGAAPADPYARFGYGGLTWSTYDLGCGGSAWDPGASVDTLVGNFLLGAAKVLFAIHVALRDASRTDAPALADAVARTSPVVADFVFSPWAGAAAVVAAAALLLATHRGDLGAVVTRGGTIVVALVVLALSFGPGPELSRELGGLVRGSVWDAGEQVVSRLAPESPLGGGGVPDRPDRLRTAVYDRVLYDGWLDGEVGYERSPGLTALGDRLLAAQTISVDEQRALDAGPPGDRAARRQALAEAKAADWRAAFEAAPPDVRDSLRGRGVSRTGAGVAVLAGTLPVTGLQILGSIAILLMTVVLQLLPVAAPLAALLTLVAPATPERAMRVLGAVVGGGIVAALCVAAHGVVVLFLIADGGGITSVVLLWIATALLYRLLRPRLPLPGRMGTTAPGPAGALVRGATRVVRRVIERTTPARSVGPAPGAVLPPPRRAALPRPRGTPELPR